jgi:hypothetical protein
MSGPWPCVSGSRNGDQLAVANLWAEQLAAVFVRRRVARRGLRQGEGQQPVNRVAGAAAGQQCPDGRGGQVAQHRDEERALPLDQIRSAGPDRQAIHPGQRGQAEHGQRPQRPRQPGRPPARPGQSGGRRHRVVLAARSPPPIRPPPTLVSCQCGRPASGQRYGGRTGRGWPEAPGMSGASTHARLAVRHPVGCASIIPMIIQTIGRDSSGAVWTDKASNVSRPDPSGAIQIDAEHPTRNRKVEGSDPSSGSRTTGQKALLALVAAQR